MQTVVVAQTGELREDLRSADVSHPVDRPLSAPTSIIRRIGLLALGLMLCAMVPYLPFLALPFISDDYVQVGLARQYGPPDNWSELANDVLYRSRATSLVFTHWVDRVFGPDALAHRSFSILVHIGNVLLIALCGLWPRIGWKFSIPAAAAFGLLEIHQEAVVWSAALPELLVFTFGLASLMFWAAWLHFRSTLCAVASFLLFCLGLLSKESGVVVVPLAALICLLVDRKWKPPLALLSAMGLIAAAYSFAIFDHAHNHLHLKDGTFSMGAPFVKTLLKSAVLMFWPWGLLSLIALRRSGVRKYGAALALSSAWVIITLLPYSFLTYMSRVPSRHTYWASLGLAVLVACGWRLLRDNRTINSRRWATAFAIVFIAGNLGYLWTKKFDQYRRRAEPTEHFLRFAAQSNDPVRILCSPYGPEAYQRAAQIGMGKPADFVAGPEQNGTGRRDYCDKSKP